jgi:oligoribonuclease NrnB/cAMP/cGMP phosphodiesterase (DHH superfamily)
LAAALAYTPRVTVENQDSFVHIVTHGPHCLDGVAAAVAVARYHSGDRVLTHFCSHEEINTVLMSLRCDPAAATHAIWITDIAWSDSTVDRHLQTLIERGVKVYLIDHHRTTLDRFKAGRISVRLTDCVLSESYAASRLVYEYLRQRLAGSQKRNEGFDALGQLIAMADDNDRWLHRIPGSRQLAATVSAMDGPDAYHELLGVDAHVTYTPRMFAAQQRAQSELARSFQVAEQSRVERPVSGAGVTLVTAVCAGYSSAIADAWGKTSPRAVFAFFDAKSLTVSLRRSPDCSLDLSHLAAQLGGGGHPAAAGCELTALRRRIAEWLATTVAEAIAS